jgi:pimeloyl-ACP methyl ester carboxylesterase
MLTSLLIAAASLVVLVIASFVVEALRKARASRAALLVAEHSDIVCLGERCGCTLHQGRARPGAGAGGSLDRRHHSAVLIRHLPLWRKAHESYGWVNVPVLLVYGDRDWSRESERQQTLREVPSARLVTVENGGHFLPLDQPEAVVHNIRAFAHQLHLAKA